VEAEIQYYDKCAVIKFHLKTRKDKKITLGNCNSVCTCRHHFKFGTKLISEVLVYKYLGVDLDFRLKLKEFKKRIITKARINLSRIWAMGINSGYLSIPAGINLWESLVRSILEYGSQIWGDEAWPEGEKVLHDFARRILRSSPSATSSALRGELGLWTLRGYRDLIKLLYFAHILTLPDDRLVKQAFYFSKRRTDLKQNWCGRIKKLLTKYELAGLWEDPQKLWNLDGHNNNEAKSLAAHKRFFQKYFYKLVLKQEEMKWWNEVMKQDKLRTYITFKDQRLRLERYLLTPGYYFGRSLMTDIRIGTNKLEVDFGRRKHKEVEHRICEQCDLKVIEDEYHFLIHCPLYADLRFKLFTDICDESKGKFDLFSAKKFAFPQKFFFLLNGSGDEFECQIFKILQKYLIRCFKLRK
jgi:hypothetical protein